MMMESLLRIVNWQGVINWLLVTAVIVTPAITMSQVTVTSTMPREMLVREGYENYAISITNETGADIENMIIDLGLPQGISYKKFSLNVIGKHTITEDNSEGTRFTIASLTNNSTASFVLGLAAECSAKDFQQAGAIFKNTLTLNYNGITQEHTSGNYDILAASLSILSVSPQDASMISGEQITRTITIVNNGMVAIDSLTITHLQATEATLVATSLGQLSGNDVLISNADFTSIGNGNNELDQNEVFSVDVTYQFISCTSKTINSIIEIGNGTGNTYCPSAATSTNTSLDFNEPAISLTTNSELLACYEASTAHQQSLTLTNTSDGIATDLIVDIFKSSGAAYDQDLLSKFDATSVTYKVNEGPVSAITPTSTYTTINTGSYACLGNGAIGAFTLQFSQLGPGDSLVINWDMYTCCPEECGLSPLGGWAADVNYSAVCDSIKYEERIVGQNPAEVSMGIFPESAPQISNGSRELFNYTIINYNNTFTANEGTRMEVIFTIPAGLYLADAKDISWTSTHGIYEMETFEYNINSGNLRMTFGFPSPFTLTQSELKLYLTGDCLMFGAGPGNMPIIMDINLIPDINCAGTCAIPVICNQIVNTTLQCPDDLCRAGGVRNLTYKIQRTTFGEADNDDDGYADINGTIDPTKVKTKRLMFGDRFAADLSGVVHSGFFVSTWQYGYGELRVPEGINTKAVSADLIIYDASEGVYLSGAVKQISRSLSGDDATYLADLSPVSLGSPFTNYIYAEGDSVHLTLNLEVTQNIGGQVQEVTTGARLFLGQTPGPTPQNQYYCNYYLDNLTLIGYKFEVRQQENYTMNSCSRTIDQEFHFSMGDCCTNFSGRNLFPCEYRNWSEIATVKVKVPAYYTVEDITLKHSYTTGSNQVTTQTINDLKYDYITNDTLIFDLSQYYTTEGGILHPSDDAYSGMVQLELSPNCNIPVDTFQHIYWAYNFNEGNNLSSNTTDWYEADNPDQLRYIPAMINLSSSNPTEDGIDKIVSWQVALSNPLASASLEHPWLHLVSPTGDIQIRHVIQAATGDTLRLTNDLYYLNTLADGEEQLLTIEATYSACGQEELIVYAGYACDALPLTYADVKCPHDYLMLSVDPKPAQLQVQIDGQTIGGECSSIIEIDLLMESVSLGAVDSLTLDITVPVTQSILNLVGQNFYSYPNTAVPLAFSDPVLHTNTYQIPVYRLADYINLHGLPCVTSNDSNKIKLTMQFELQGHFTLGEFIQFTFNYKSSCGDNLPGIKLSYDPYLDFERREISGLTTEQDNNWGASWGDFNNDGYDDLFLTEYDANKPNVLFKNNGDYTFTKMTAAPIATDLASSLASSWADYDNDGDLDILVANNIGSPNFLYRNNGDETFTKITSGHIVTYDGHAHGVTWADYDLDGYQDVFISDFKPTRTNLLYRNLGDGTFELITTGDITTQTGHSIGASWADADGDGDPDLFVPNVGEQNEFYLNEGGELVLQTASILTQDTSYSTSGSWGDFDNDGDLDLLVANASTHPNKLYVNDGTGSFTLSNSIISNGNTNGSTWADFDNDGDLDLFLANDQLEANEFYSNNGDGTFTALPAGLTRNYEDAFGAAVADIENDGDLDLFIPNHSGKENLLFINSGGQCLNYFCATLFSANNSKNTIGAKVFATATINGQLVSQMREIRTQTGGGAGSQNSLKVHFGMGDATVVDEIRIEWPSGNTQYLVNQSVNDCVSIYETAGSLLTGIAYFDANGNCIQDGEETTLANQEIIIAPIGRKLYTDKNGKYKTYLPDGVYTLSGSTLDNFSFGCTPRELIVTGGGNNTYQDLDFGYQASCMDPDLEVNLAVNALRQGFDNDLFVSLTNSGGATANKVELKLVLPQGITANSSTLPWDSQDGNTLLWNFNTILPEEVISFTIRESVSFSFEEGEITTHQAYSGTSTQHDCDSSNNEIIYNQVIVRELAPNDKIIECKNGGHQDHVLKNERVKYKIRFQNTGNHDATRVTVIDTIDAQFDIESISEMMTSHPAQIYIDGNVITWIFHNINLPTVRDQEPESHGFITFNIKTKSDISVGREVKNTAYIQFDFEDFIATNTVRSHVLNHLLKINTQKVRVSINPNPASDYAYISLINPGNDLSRTQKLEHIDKITIMRIDGSRVREFEGNGLFEVKLDVSDLVAGTYLIRMESKSGNTAYEKLVKH